MPRMLMFSPPVLPALPETSTPSTSLSASARLETRFLFNSSALITVMLAGASTIFCSKPEALTTVSLSTTASWACAAKAHESRAQDSAVRAKGRDMRNSSDDR